MNNNQMFSFDQLKEFIEKYPIRSFEKELSGFNINETDIYLTAFMKFIQTKNDIMPDYFKIKDILCNLIHTLQYYEMKDISYSEVSYLLNYNGYWNVDYLIGSFGLSREKLEFMLREIQEGFPSSINEKTEINHKEQEEFIKSYYKAKRTMSNEEINRYFIYEINQNINKKYDKDITDIKNIKYPILVFLYKNDKVVSVNKIISSLDGSLVKYRENKDFDEYAYLYIPEEIIDDIFAEALVRYNPLYMYTNAITVKNSIYRTLNHIKKRYKEDERIDLRVIKKILNIYEIPLYNLSNGTAVVDKDLFDDAIKKYFGMKNI